MDTDPTADAIGATVELEITSGGRFDHANAFWMDTVVEADCTEVAARERVRSGPQSPTFPL